MYVCVWAFAVCSAARTDTSAPTGLPSFESQRAWWCAPCVRRRQRRTGWPFGTVLPGRILSHPCHPPAHDIELSPRAAAAMTASRSYSEGRGCGESPNTVPGLERTPPSIHEALCEAFAARALRYRSCKRRFFCRENRVLRERLSRTCFGKLPPETPGEHLVTCRLASASPHGLLMELVLSEAR